MVNIKVPINLKGSLNIETSKLPTSPQLSQTANSDIQFIKNVHDELRFQIQVDVLQALGDEVVITPPNGTTFYFLGASVSYEVVSGTATIGLFNDEVARDRVLLIGDNTNDYVKIALQFDSLIGNGAREYKLRMEPISIGADITATGTIWGYFANSIRV